MGNQRPRCPGLPITVRQHVQELNEDFGDTKVLLRLPDRNFTNKADYARDKTGLASQKGAQEPSLRLSRIKNKVWNT